MILAELLNINIKSQFSSAWKSKVVFALLIINKAGGLVYNRTFHPGLNTLSSNDLLILAGTFHGVHAITASLIPHSLHPSNNLPPSTSQNTASQNFPVKATGLEVLESSHFRLTCFQTLTGTKFLLFTEPAQPNVDMVIKRVYELYADFVMKNPFYTVEMPVRCAKFDSGLDTYIKVRS
ncbi:TRS23 Transport protein particle (TRAPP) complex subunit [Venturia nashicola]|uniref:Trafficking protein particle complex subunit n=1 Tax=Venturia nashicola TaxID=86259 RepID=A0A4Z1NSB5_9PEZI|nr:TRS23 Transport protein particle (TRAPP) complex subunit [Venturia nashicola]